MSKTQENEFERCLLKDGNDEGASRLSDIEYEKPMVLNPDLGYDEND